jgi:L-ribulokinase
VEGIVGVGGIARKSKYVMQVMADVLNMPIKVNRSDQVCARGAAMLAATAAGCYPDVSAAMNAMGAGFDITYTPDQRKQGLLERRYRQYETICRMTEEM